MPQIDKNPEKIGAMFSTIAGRYDRANRLLSLGQDQRWRRSLVRWAVPRDGQRVLDVCTGTGDLAMAFARAADVAVTGLDIAERMLAVAKTKALQAAISDRIAYVHGNALTLPFATASFEVVSIAFGLRNLPDYAAGLREMFRCLTPGGRAFVLEFSRPHGLWGAVYGTYLRHGLPVLGGWLTGKPEAYRYLDASIRDFPAAGDLGRLLRSVGFSRVVQRPLWGGVAFIHRAEKP